MVSVIIPHRRGIRRTSSVTTLTSTTDSIPEKESHHRKVYWRDNGFSHKYASKKEKKKLQPTGYKILGVRSISSPLKSSALKYDENGLLLRERKSNDMFEGLSRVENKCPPTTKTYNTQINNEAFDSVGLSTQSRRYRNVSSSLPEIFKRRGQAKTRVEVFNIRNDDAASANNIKIYDGTVSSRDGPITSMDHTSMRAKTTKLATASSSSITNYGESSTDIDTKEGASRLDEAITAIDRASIRLDGIEVYAMVSSLTIGTSVSLCDLHYGHETNWLLGLFQSGEYLSLITGIGILCASVSTILSGLHATLIFSLMTMYGRTAVGVGNDNGFSEFFKTTGHIRYRAFQSFRLSLYSFLMQVILTMSEKVPEGPRLFGLFFIFFSCSRVYGDTEDIIRLASNILFKPIEKRD